MPTADDPSSDLLAAFTYSLDGIMISAPDGKVFAVNPAACRLLGREHDEILRLGRAAVVDPTDPEVLHAIEVRRRTGNFRGELHFLRKGGERFPVEISTGVYESLEGLERTVMIFRDISERKRSQEQLELSEAKFARAFHSSPDGITITRRSDGAYLEVNPGFTLISGYQADEVLGRTPGELGIWARAEDRQRFVRELEERGEVVNQEFEFQFKGGRPCTTLVSARCIEIGGVPCILSTTRDITERKRLEEALMQTQKLESIGLLAGGIAHDFNNMLGGLLGFIEVAEVMADQGRLDKVQTYLKKALDIYPRARGLTRQLLTFAKGGEPVRALNHLGPLVRNSTLFALSGSNVLAEFDLPEGLWPCHCDEVQIGQVIDNLVLNARQAMPQGGSLRATARNVTSVVGREGPYVQITVTDQGPGIEPELLTRIFEPFVTTKATGHGLGLATVASVMQRHHGWVDVSSVVGEGTTFRLFLPASPAGGLVEARGSEQDAHGGEGTVLVMDDDAHVLEVTAFWLEAMGYQVVSCNNGVQALEAVKAALARSAPLCAAILDLTIPGTGGGVEVARTLLASDPNLVLVAATGYSENPVMAHPGEFGFQAKLVKPFQRKDLARVFSALFPQPGP